MTREQAAAHERLAGLPRRVHLQVRKTEEEIALERGRRSASVKRMRGTNHKGPQIWLDGSSTLKRKKR